VMVSDLFPQFFPLQIAAAREFVRMSADALRACNLKVTPRRILQCLGQSGDFG